MQQPLKADHPHIERRPGVCGGSAVIAGTRIPVRLIVGFVKDGISADEILSSYTDLSSEKVQAAIDYYADHTEEIDREIAECDLAFVEKKFGLKLDSRGFLVPRNQRPVSPASKGLEGDEQCFADAAQCYVDSSFPSFEPSSRLTAKLTW